MNEQKPIAELVAELRGLLAKATPGPWDVFDVDDYSGIRAADGERVVQILRYESDANFCEEDDLIVAMRNSLPAILDELERLQLLTSVERFANQDAYAACCALEWMLTP